MPPRRRITRQNPEGSTNNNNNNDGTNPNSVQQLVNLLTGALVNQPQVQGTMFKEFKALGPPEFKGSVNPIDAQTWVMEMEKVFDVARVNEDQKTAFATFMLKVEAIYWWQENKVRGG